MELQWWSLKMTANEYMNPATTRLVKCTVNLIFIFKNLFKWEGFLIAVFDTITFFRKMFI